MAVAVTQTATPHIDDQLNVRVDGLLNQHVAELHKQHVDDDRRSYMSQLHLMNHRTTHVHQAHLAIDEPLLVDDSNAHVPPQDLHTVVIGHLVRLQARHLDVVHSLLHTAGLLQALNPSRNTTSPLGLLDQHASTIQTVMMPLDDRAIDLRHHQVHQDAADDHHGRHTTLVLGRHLLISMTLS